VPIQEGVVLGAGRVKIVSYSLSGQETGEAEYNAASAKGNIVREGGVGSHKLRKSLKLSIRRDARQGTRVNGHVVKVVLRQTAATGN